MKERSFYELFCAKHKCQPAEFEQVVLRRCFYSNRYYLGRLIAALNPDFLHEDLALIADLKGVTNAREIRAEINTMRTNRRAGGLFRGLLKVRLSGQRLLVEAERLFSRPD